MAWHEQSCLFSPPQKYLEYNLDSAGNGTEKHLVVNRDDAPFRMYRTLISACFIDFYQQNNLFTRILNDCCSFGFIHGRLISGNRHFTSVGNENLYCQYTADSNKQEVIISLHLFEVSTSALKLWPFLKKQKKHVKLFGPAFCSKFHFIVLICFMGAIKQ